MTEEKLSAHQVACFYSSNDDLINNVAPQINGY